MKGSKDAQQEDTMEEAGQASKEHKEHYQPEEGGATEDDGDNDSEVTVPEEYQKQVGELLGNTKTKHHVDHLRSRMNEHETYLQKEAMRKSPKDPGKGPKIGIPSEYSTADMPSY